MNSEELDSFQELNIDLTDIDELNMGLEIISYKARKIIEELANIVVKRNSVLFNYQDKIREIEEFYNDILNEYKKDDKKDKTREFYYLSCMELVMNIIKKDR